MDQGMGTPRSLVDTSDMEDLRAATHLVSLDIRIPTEWDLNPNHGHVDPDAEDLNLDHGPHRASVLNFVTPGHTSLVNLSLPATLTLPGLRMLAGACPQLTQLRLLKGMLFDMDAPIDYAGSPNAMATTAAGAAEVDHNPLRLPQLLSLKQLEVWGEVEVDNGVTLQALAPNLEVRVVVVLACWEAQM